MHPKDDERIAAVHRLAAAISEHASFVIRYPGRSPSRRIAVEQAAATNLLRLFLGHEPSPEEIAAALDYPRDPLVATERSPKAPIPGVGSLP
jgi:hypothetical protein